MESTPKRNCSKCDASRDTRPFCKGKNICKLCMKLYDAKIRAGKHRQYAIKRREWQESNFTNWIRVLLITTRAKRQKAPKKHKNQLTVTLEYILSILESQDFKCALTGLPLLRIVNHPQSASIDRIESEKGYEDGNIQLVCRAMNFAKSNYSNQAMKEFVAAIRSV